MNINGKLVQLLPVQTGTGKNGTWKKQDIILETEGQYPKKLCVAVWGDKIDTASLKIGDQLNVYFDVESREFNGKWYTDVKAWKIETGAADAKNPKQDFPYEDKASDIPPPPEPEDDLPF
jgi:hypothetical protein